MSTACQASWELVGLTLLLLQALYAAVLNKAMAYAIIAVGALGFTGPTTVASIISNHTNASEQARPQAQGWLLTPKHRRWSQQHLQAQ